MAYVSLQGSTKTSLTLRCRQLSNSTNWYGKFEFYINGSLKGTWYPNGTNYADGINQGYYTSGDVNISGLSCGTNYSVYCKIYRSDGVYQATTSTVSLKTSACDGSPSPADDIDVTYISGKSGEVKVTFAPRDNQEIVFKRSWSSTSDTFYLDNTWEYFEYYWTDFPSYNTSYSIDVWFRDISNGLESTKKTIYVVSGSPPADSEVKGFNVVANDYKSATATWTANNTYFTGYNIYYRNPGESAFKHNTTILSANTSSYIIDSGLRGGDTYLFYIVGIKKDGSETDHFYNEKSVTMPTSPAPNVPNTPVLMTTTVFGAPFDPYREDLNGASLYIKSPNDPPQNDGITFYTLEIKVIRGYDNYDYAYTSADVDNIYFGEEVKNLQFGVRYYFQMRIANDQGWSGWTSVSEGYVTKPKSPVIAASNITGSSIQINATNMTDTNNWSYINIFCVETNTTKKIEYGTKAVTFNGLSPNTTYTFKARTYYTVDGGDLPSVNESGMTATTTALTVPLPTTPSSSPVFTSMTEGGVNLSWGSSSNVTGYEYKYIRQYDGYEYSKTSTSTSGSFTGMQFAVNYGFTVRAYNVVNGVTYYSDWTTVNYGHTLPKTPTISIGTKTETSMTIQVQDDGWSSLNWDEIQIFLYLESGDANGSGTKYTISRSQWINSGVKSVTITGLISGRTYWVNARSRFTTNTGSQIYSVSYSTRLSFTTVNNRPYDWRWGGGLPVDVNGNITTITLNSDRIFPADQWLGFVERVRQFRKYKNMDETAYMHNTPSNIGYNNEFKADMFNEILNHMVGIPTINGLNNQHVSITDGLSASRFNNLMNAINSIP